jgi:DNA modification methylase
MNRALYNGDCLEIMRGFNDGCIDLTVTSPPYDNLRAYRGYTFDFEPIARELYRVTKPGGVVVWVVGDATINGSETGTSFRQALYFKEIGFNLHDTMIYEVAGTGAKGSHSAYWQTFEYMFVFCKGTIKTVNRIADHKNTFLGGGGRFRENGGKEKRHESPPVGIRSNIWRYHAGNNGDDFTNHPAPFPEDLARDHILSWSNPGDTVLDCFLGSGTTGKMAVKYQRNFIGIEIAPEYLEIARKRIAQVEAQPLLFQGVSL